ncbi:MAG: nitrous oxide reductase accessory protein NosL [Campylobacterota bacterium]|nr:nitrous oxide reductase accessory protein NosL [Campylobacterota bacterium]
MIKKTALVFIATTALLMAAPIEVSKEKRCLIRQIKVYENPAWIAKAVTRQKKDVYFSSPKSMFEYYFNPIRWTELGAISPDDVTSVSVTDFKTLEATDARSAYFVYGSAIVGPAGDDLVPFAEQKDAEAFMKKYNGKRILRFSEIKLSLINLINGRI